MRVKRTQTHPRHRPSFLQSFEQPGQVDLGMKVCAIAAQMNTGQDHFLKALVGQAVELLQDDARGNTAAFAARHGHNTKRTEQVAAFLNFKKRPRLALKGYGSKGIDVWRGFMPGGPQLADKNLPVRWLNGGGTLSNQANQIVEPIEPDNIIHFGHMGHGTRAHLCITAGHNDLGLRVAPLRPAHQLAALGVRLIGDGATIDDIDLSSLAERNTLMAGGREKFLQRGRIILIHLTAQRGEGNPTRGVR